VTDDEVIIISDPQEAEVLIVPEKDVLVVDDEIASVLVVNEGTKGDKGDPGEVPEWVNDTRITVSNTEPQNPNIGDLWIDTN
jgi:hypothetical protein